MRTLLLIFYFSFTGSSYASQYVQEVSPAITTFENHIWKQMDELNKPEKLNSIETITNSCNYFHRKIIVFLQKAPRNDMKLIDSDIINFFALHLEQLNSLLTKRLESLTEFTILSWLECLHFGCTFLPTAEDSAERADASIKSISADNFKKMANAPWKKGDRPPYQWNKLH